LVKENGDNHDSSCVDELEFINGTQLSDDENDEKNLNEDNKFYDRLKGFSSNVRKFIEKKKKLTTQGKFYFNLC